jgi:hypothetical protein
MQEEYDALMHNNTWSLVPPPPGANIVSSKWIFRPSILRMALLLAIKLAG